MHDANEYINQLENAIIPLTFKLQIKSNPDDFSLWKNENPHVINLLCGVKTTYSKQTNLQKKKRIKTMLLCQQHKFGRVPS